MSQARKNEWQRQSRAAFVAANGYSITSHYATGGNRALVLARDGYACLGCGMTDVQHRAKWGRPITIDHKNKDRSDNSMDNLQTLCLTCHGRKDLLPSLRTKKAEPLRPRMRELRAAGKTYQAIADAVGVSISCAWKSINGETK